jgi:hypothetical protein
MLQATMQPVHASSDGAGERLMRQIRARFVERGKTLNRWCKENGVKRQWADQAIVGKSRGPAARKLAERIAAAAGVK